MRPKSQWASEFHLRKDPCLFVVFPIHSWYRILMANKLATLSLSISPWDDLLFSGGRYYLFAKGGI